MNNYMRRNMSNKPVSVPFCYLYDHYISERRNHAGHQKHPQNLYISEDIDKLNRKYIGDYWEND